MNMRGKSVELPAVDETCLIYKELVRLRQSWLDNPAFGSAAWNAVCFHVDRVTETLQSFVGTCDASLIQHDARQARGEIELILERCVPHAVRDQLHFYHEFLKEIGTACEDQQ
jgi:hypothetical protein